MSVVPSAIASDYEVPLQSYQKQMSHGRSSAPSLMPTKVEETPPPPPPRRKGGSQGIQGKRKDLKFYQVYVMSCQNKL